MKLATFEVTVPIDEEVLADHIQDAEKRGGPYTADFGEWDCSDLFRAASEHDIIDPGEGEIRFVGAEDQE